MKAKRLSTLLLFSIIYINNTFSQNPCEVFCSTEGEFVNVCTECGNVIAADDCADAATPSICELDGFSTTICDGTYDGPEGFEPCGPDIEFSQNTWIGFTPVTDGRLHLTVEITECLSANTDCNGIKAGIIRALCANPGNVFFSYQILDCVNCVDQTFDLITVDAIGGVPHYIMIDQCCEDVCEIAIHVVDGLPDPAWELVSLTSSIVLNDDDPACFSRTSSIIATAEPNADANLNAPLIFIWFDPGGNEIFRGPPNNGTNSSILTGIDPLTGDPYICDEGTYSVELLDISTCCKDEMEIVIQNETNSVQNTLDENIITIFPNPTSNIINLHFENGKPRLENIQILNLNGKSVQFHYETKNGSINLVNLKAGFYFLRVVLEDGSIISRKIAKI